MSRTRSHVRVAVSSAEFDSESGRDFLQERLGIFAFWNCILSLGFLTLRLIAQAAIDPAFTWSGAARTPDVLLHASAAACPGIVSLIARRARPFVPRTLRTIDAVMIVIVGAGYATMG